VKAVCSNSLSKAVFSYPIAISTGVMHQILLIETHICEVSPYAEGISKGLRWLSR